MEYIIFAAGVVLFLMFISIKGYFDDRRRRKYFIEKLRDSYGELPHKEYKPEVFAAIAKYYERHRQDGQLDDITWNDLDMDRIFMCMDHTLSSAGAEYLYYTLRTPKLSEEEFDGMEEQIRYFMEHEEDRISLQKLFAQLGTTGKFSLYDYLDYLDALGERDNRKHYLADAVIIMALVLSLVTGESAMIALLLMGVIFNITTYLRDKKEIEPYIISISYVLRLIRITDRLQKNAIPLIQKEKEALAAYRQRLKQFTSNTSLVMSNTTADGNPLDILLVYIKMIFHLDLIKFNQMITDIRDCEKEIDGMLTIVGHIETVIAIGAFRASMPEHCIPKLYPAAEQKSAAAEACGDVGIQAVNMYHPLIHDPVKNSITTQKGVLLTGSNASGKSTFLKTVAIGAVLAQTINCVPADSYSAPYFRIYSSMALRDDLQSGESYYIVEIKSLKRILSAAEQQTDAAEKQQETPILCFVDEVLRGTNTVERIAASTQILKSLAGARVLCFAATHDIELTHLLEKEFDNYHFEEEIVDGDVLFNYELKEGRSMTRNAIKLLSVMGYDKNIIDCAEQLAARFLADGSWNS